MNKQIVGDAQGRVIGELLDQGSVIILLSATGEMLGRYVKNHDYTYDAVGRKVGWGTNFCGW
jgi:hypothetical protein